MKRFISLFLAMIMLCTMLAACEGGGSPSMELGDFDIGEGLPQEKGKRGDGELSEGSSVVDGKWGDMWPRSHGHSYPATMSRPPEHDGGYTYPFIFDEPLRSCKGFTLDYKIHEVVEGDLGGNFRYEVFLRNVNKEWRSIGVFDMSGTSTTLTVTLSDPTTITGVAIVCGKEATFSFSIVVRKPVY